MINMAYNKIKFEVKNFVKVPLDDKEGLISSGSYTATCKQSNTSIKPEDREYTVK